MNTYVITSNPIISNYKKRLEKLGKLTVLDVQKLTEKEVIDRCGNCELLIIGSSGITKISEKLLKGLKKLKFISLLTVGTDWVDLKSAKKLNIPVANIKGANAESVAEHAWGMIINLAKRISELDRDMREKGEYRFNPYKGKEVFGKTLGIIGLGDIGKKVARIAKAFDMKILGLNKSGKTFNGVNLVNKNTLLKESDVIAVTLPLNNNTENFIDFKEINKMKRGVILVNTSREIIVNEKAVIEGIKQGKIYGYGLETEIMQPVPKKSDLFKYPNIILTAHNGFNTEDADRKSYDLAIENIEKFLAGKLQNIVN
jgi:phosphoglycerate dehydrogenase-like enzyme